MEIELIIMFTIALSLLMAIVSVYVPISSIGTFIVNVIVLLPLIITNPAPDLHTLMIAGFAVTTLIGFFGVRQVSR